MTSLDLLLFACGTLAICIAWSFMSDLDGQNVEDIGKKIVLDVKSKVAVALTKEEAVMLGNMLIHLGSK